MPPSTPVPTVVADGGWGWVCVAALAFNLALYRGIAVSFSILFEALRDKYDASATAAAWVYAIYGMVVFFSAILVSPLCKRFGCRAIGMIGGVFHGLGMILTAYTTDMEQVYITYGVLVGFANCTISVTLPLVINQYFDKHRAKAMSLNTLGVSVGTVVFSNLMSVTTEKFGLTFCMAILACISLHQVVSSALFRPPDKKVYLKVEKNGLAHTSVVMEDAADVELESITAINPSGNDDSGKYNKSDGENVIGEKRDSSWAPVSTTLETGTQEESRFIQADTGKDTETNTRINNIKECCLYYCDIDLFMNMQFLAFVFMTVCYSLCMFMMDTILAGYAKERGVSISQVSWVISVATGMEVIGRLLSGVVLDLKKLRPIRTYIYGGLTLVATVCLMMFPSAQDFISIMMLFMTNRFCASIFFTHNSVILSDVATPAKMYGAIGILQFTRGISALTGPTMGGFIKDVYGSYDGGFYIGGGLSMFSLVLYFTTLLWSSRRRRKHTPPVVA